jgi:GTPase
METIRTRTKHRGLPVVAIVGRPNVGKSTLFNRLLHDRRAITDPTPGVTRDPIEAECVLDYSGRCIVLVDTGGFKLEREGFDSLVVEKSLAALAKADLILLLMDVTEVTPEDESFAEYLRRFAAKTVLAVNKADSVERERMAFEYLRFGFAGAVAISAEHGRNIDELEELIVSKLDFSNAEEYEDVHEDVRIAILGKPNTGKSTLMNRLLGEEKSIVSEVPGTTRDVVEGCFSFKGKPFTVLDTAGIRRKAKVTENIEYYSVNRAIKTLDDCDIAILMIDAKAGLTDQDKKIAALAEERGRGIIFALNKWDEMPELKNSFEAAKDRLRYFFGQMAYAPVLPLSGKTGFGVDKLLNVALEMFGQLTRRIDTGPLNQAVREWVEGTPPPVGPQTHFKLRYATQVSVNPVKFVIFVSRPQAVLEAYVAYLRNRIRKDLGFGLIPLELELKGSRREDKE